MIVPLFSISRKQICIDIWRLMVEEETRLECGLLPALLEHTSFHAQALYLMTIAMVLARKCVLADIKIRYRRH